MQACFCASRHMPQVRSMLWAPTEASFHTQADNKYVHLGAVQALTSLHSMAKLHLTEAHPRGWCHRSPHSPFSFSNQSANEAHESLD